MPKKKRLSERVTSTFQNDVFEVEFNFSLQLNFKVSKFYNLGRTKQKTGEADVS